MFVCATAAVSAQESFVADGINYKITGVATVSVERKTGDNYVGNVVIPAEVSNDGKTYSVTAIGRGAFYNSMELISVGLGRNVAEIGVSAFAGCLGLQKIEVDASNASFSSADGVLFNKNKTLLVKYPAAKEAETYIVPDGVAGIEVQAFDYTAAMSGIRFPESLQAIGAYAFMASSVIEIEIPDQVSYIGDYAFYQCPLLSKVTLGKGLTEISGFTFNTCKELKEVTVKGDLKSIGDYAFFSCFAMEEFQLPESLESIGAGAFKSCEKLRGITIGKNVKDIGLIPFSFCKAMRSIKVDEANQWFKDIDGVLCDKAGTRIVEYPAGRPGEYEIPSGITVIGNNAFYYCTRLNDIRIPEGVVAIEASAFHACQGLKTVSIPGSVRSVGSQAFMFCEELEAVSIGYGVAEIGTMAFSMCGKLRQIDALPVTPPTLASDNVFSTETYASCHLTVPSEGLQTYREAFGWRGFNHIESMTGGVAIENDDADAGEIWTVYSLAGELVYRGGKSGFTAPCQGIYIVNDGKTTRKIKF